MLKFHSYKNHNPAADILELKLNADTFITYVVYVKNTARNKKGDELMEYYTGANYCPQSTKKSYSRAYKIGHIPSKYRGKFIKLNAIYQKEYQNA